MFLIISKEHFLLLVWVEFVDSSIIYDLDTKPLEGKLPVVSAGYTGIISYYSLATAFSGAYFDSRNGDWRWLPDVVCELVGNGTVP